MHKLFMITLMVVALLCTSCGDSTRPCDCPRVTFVEWRETIKNPRGDTYMHWGVVKNTGTKEARSVRVETSGDVDHWSDTTDPANIMPGERARFLGAETSSEQLRPRVNVIRWSSYAKP